MDTHNPTWRDAGRCRPGQGIDPETFSPVDAGSAYSPGARAAKAICRHCPVVRDCLLDALDGGDDHTIRGGLTARERRQLRNRSAA